MRLKVFFPAFAILTTVLAVPADAQYAPAYGSGYHGPAYAGPAYRTRGFRGGYYAAPVVEPYFYNDGWVPEPIFDHSRTGGIDPNIRPPS
jgi:hypothetical protein